MEHWAQNVEKHHSADSSGWVQMELVMTEMQRSLNARCRSFQFQEEVAGGRNDDRNAKVVECAKHCRRFQFQKGVSIRGQATLWFTSGTRLATTPLRAWVRGRRLTTTSWGGVSPDLASPVKEAARANQLRGQRVSKKWGSTW